VKRYDELCSILNLRCYPQPSRLQEQLGPSLNELQAHGYLAAWTIEPTSDREAYKIVFRHGEKFHRDRRRRLSAEFPSDVPDEGAAPEPDAAPASPLTGWIEALHERGVTRKEAEKVLAAAPAGQPVLDQIEWGEAVVAKDPRKIQNPAGFLLSLIRDNVSVPENFETSRKHQARAVAADARHAQQEAKARLQAAYTVYQEAEVAKHLASLDPVVLADRLAAIARELRVAHQHLTQFMNDEQMLRTAKAKLAADVAKELTLLSFTAFCRQHKGGEPATATE
jgi:hypothetical protein